MVILRRVTERSLGGRERKGDFDKIGDEHPVRAGSVYGSCVDAIVVLFTVNSTIELKEVEAFGRCPGRSAE